MKRNKFKFNGRRPIILGFFLLFIFSSCKKKNIESNIQGTWNVLTFVDGGDDLVDVWDPIVISFTNLNDGAGNSSFSSPEISPSTLNGTFSLDSNYESINLVYIFDGLTWTINGNFNVTETSLSINGSSKYSNESTSNSLVVTASK
ncbi:MAG: hypothetical protein MK078_01680 [Crocinitomicaceae bacterium]|nr:hypothetical protein [Crocinitomicaceae bacterium]MCH2232932.1 hypothetical protein [Crocinitomicaceae bacterium]